MADDRFAAPVGVTALRVRNWNSLYENNRTRELKRMEWVPVPNRMDGDGFTELLDHPNGIIHFACWSLCLQVASRCQPRGVLVRGDGRPHDAASLARMTRTPKSAFEEAIPRLVEIGWLERFAHDGAGISREGAGISREGDQKGAGSLRLSDYGMEWKEGNGRNGTDEPRLSALDYEKLWLLHCLKYDDTSPEQEERLYAICSEQEIEDYLGVFGFEDCKPTVGAGVEDIGD